MSTFRRVTEDSIPEILEMMEEFYAIEKYRFMQKISRKTSLNFLIMNIWAEFGLSFLITISPDMMRLPSDSVLNTMALTRSWMSFSSKNLSETRD